MVKFFSLISTKSVFAPKFSIQLAVAKKVIGVVIIVSFFFQPKALAVINNAAVPFETTALYLDPKILILDEATNALDINTELDIFNSIIKSYEDLTIIWITHRPSSLSLCNNIFYLNKGSIKYLNNEDNSIKDDDYIKNILQKEI